ncbi:hypothetical protein DFH06DRAFT_377654 [Mycena polygramma]|nr:hypothetical protein DFH06DRAFT_377654 [Mycena polygramma]
MRVSIYTEVEPPEQRPCPPLPLEGPILLQVVFAPSTTVSAPSGVASDHLLAVKPESSAVPVILAPCGPSKSLGSLKLLARLSGLTIILALLAVSIFLCLGLIVDPGAPKHVGHGTGSLQMPPHLVRVRHGRARILWFPCSAHDLIRTFCPNHFRICARRLPDGAMSILWHGG